ncbi:MAG: biosynthetic peptidoglycan transglycosylase [Deltaproteobacteria bacterium]|nr:biosynthetic peptidoglycan transglycosylase [Deltaproteobacteria bacterium]
MRKASGRVWARTLVAAFSALFTFTCVFWIAFAQPWVARALSERTGFAVTIGRLYPAFGARGLVLVVRDVVVAGRAPFESEPLAFCDRIEIKPGRPLGVDVSGLDLRILVARSADNVRGVRRGKGASRVGSGGGVDLKVHSGRVSALVQLPGGQRLAARVTQLQVQRNASGSKASLGGLSLDLAAKLSARLQNAVIEITSNHDVLVQGQELAVTLPGGAPLLAGVAIEASASARGWTASAHTPGAKGAFAAQAAFTPEGLTAQLDFHDLPLAGFAPLFDVMGVALQRASATANASVAWTPGSTELAWQIEAQVGQVALHHPALDKEPWRAQAARGKAQGRFDWREGRLTLADANVVPLGLPIKIEGWTTVWGEKRGELSLLTADGGWDCARMPARFAPSVQGALWGIELGGRLEARVDLAFSADDWDKLALNIRVPRKCTVKKEAAVLASDLPTLVAATGQLTDRPALPVSPASADFTPLAKMPPHLLAAFMTAEDAGFFSHQGFEPENIRKALVYDLERGRMARGASTITQQVAKNLFLSHDRTLARKLTETVLTWRVDSLVPKRRVLELYLNLVELGPGIRGVGAAARAYFGKEPEALTPLEAAHLASLPPNPRGFARRFREGSVDDGWLARLYDLVGIMGRRGQLSAAQVSAARGSRLRLRKI